MKTKLEVTSTADLDKGTPDTESLCVWAHEELGLSKMRWHPSFAKSHDALVPLIEKIRAEVGNKRYSEVLDELVNGDYATISDWEHGDQEAIFDTEFIEAMIHATPLQKLMACYLACLETE